MNYKEVLSIETEDTARCTGIVRDPRYQDHIAGPGHPESPERLTAIYERLDQEDIGTVLESITPRAATKDELGWSHTPSYIDLVQATSGRKSHQLDPDTATSPASWHAACLAVGGVFALLDAIDNSIVDNGFALIRPPGHHAEADRAMGFCLFNNIALGAHYGRHVLGYERIAIVDWDLHHGNGTQNSFYSDPNVLYFSTHQYPYYPGSGGMHEIGEGKGKGFTVNVPLSVGAGDETYAAVFNRLLVPVCKSFSPDLILVSAGFDIYVDDPLGGMRVSQAGFAYLARVLLELADSCCGGNLLFCLEGGYDLQGLADGVVGVLKECKGGSIMEKSTVELLRRTGSDSGVVDRAVKVHAGSWPVV